MRELGEHLRMAWIIVAAGEERGFIDRRSDDSLDFSTLCELDRSFYGDAAERSRARGVGTASPITNRIVDVRGGIGRANHHDVATLANPWVSERFGDDLWSDAAGVSHGHGEPNL